MFVEVGTASWVNFIVTASGSWLRSEYIVLAGWVTSVVAGLKAWGRLEGAALGG